jgi:Subtilase family
VNKRATHKQYLTHTHFFICLSTIAHEQFEGRATCAISMVEGEDCADGHGHGTHCSGTVGGRDYGVAKKANIIGVKVLDNTGSGSNAGIIAGMDWVTSQAAATGRKSIMSLSLGGQGSSSAMDQAVENAVEEGILIVGMLFIAVVVVFVATAPPFPTRTKAHIVFWFVCIH